MVFNVPAHADSETVTFQNLTNINLNAFERDIKYQCFYHSEVDITGDLANQYNTEFFRIIKHHSPLKTKRVSRPLEKQFSQHAASSYVFPTLH